VARHAAAETAGLDTPKSWAAALERNKQTLLAELAKMALLTVEVHYSGEDDEGGTTHLWCFDAEGGMAGFERLSGRESVGLWMPAQAHGRLVADYQDFVLHQMDLHQGVDLFAWDVVTHHHPNFWRGPGGVGVVRLHPLQGVAVISHDDHIIETVHRQTRV
jgi:hypothetical protein